METQLPIASALGSLIELLRAGKNVSLTAPTGSGKTTQVPQAILDSHVVEGVIVVVQPRRVACRSVALRVAEERRVRIGTEVGYIVRQDSRRSPHTRILFVTDGVLIRFLEEDRDLSWIGALVFDEFHERRLLSDVALGLAKAAQRRRPDLRLVVMSATFDSAHVSRYLDAVPLASEGRAFPVDIRHVAATIPQEELSRNAAELIREYHRSNAPGDILVFMPGKQEIERTVRLVEDMRERLLTVLPLHGALPHAEQDRVFAPAIGRKAVISTNVAETSVTIPGIATVIDTGFERRKEFDYEYGVDRLLLQRVSKASASQRAGRAGRERAGICVRLWSEESHLSLTENALPEIQVTDLADLVLTLKSVGIHDPTGFDFLDAPDMERLKAGESLLRQLGALDAQGTLTTTGWRMLRLPLSPRYARMVVEAERSGCVKEVATIASFMSGSPIFLRPGQNRRQKRNEDETAPAHENGSDLLSLLTLYRQGTEHNWSEEWCVSQALNASALREARDLRANIIRIATVRRGTQVRLQGNRLAIPRCLLAGLLDRIAVQKRPGVFRFGNGLRGRADASTKTESDLVAFGEIRSAHKGRGVAAVRLGLDVRRDMLTGLAPHLLSHRRIPIRFERATASLWLQEETRFLDVLLTREERRADLVEADEVLAEQDARAVRNGWVRVDVQKNASGNRVVEWGKKLLNVETDHEGPHWATIRRGRKTIIHVEEPIVAKPDMEGPPITGALQERIGKLSPALSQLLGRSR